MPRRYNRNRSRKLDTSFYQPPPNYNPLAATHPIPARNPPAINNQQNIFNNHPPTPRVVVHNHPPVPRVFVNNPPPKIIINKPSSPKLPSHFIGFVWN